jgi:hypothetical protein
MAHRSRRAGPLRLDLTTDTPAAALIKISYITQMEHSQIWAKASLGTRCSLSTSSRPLWVGVDVTTGKALASLRWDIPAGYRELAEVIHESQRAALVDDIAHARLCKKPDDHVCFAVPNLALAGPAPTPAADGQFGMTLDSNLLQTLKAIDHTDMAWITDDTRRELYNSFARLSSQHIELILWAIHRAGLSVSVSPPSGAAFRFGGVPLSECQPLT